jgi:hypothetical protein
MDGPLPIIHSVQNSLVATFSQNQKSHYASIRCISIFILSFFSITARHLPFRVGVNFDNNERASIVTAVMTDDIEQQGSPGGIIGFKLTYFQVGC